MAFELPPRSQVGYLDPEIAGEGQKVVTEGELSWSPPPVMPVMPDWSQIKSIRKYFNRAGGGSIFPVWLFHPTEPDREVANAEEALKLGVWRRKATIEEGSQFGVQYTWDWKRGAEDLGWRPTRQKPPKFDPHNPGTGKVYNATPPSQSSQQNALLEALVPAIAASVATAVAQALKSAGNAPASTVDPGKIAVEAVTEAVSSIGNALTAPLDEDEEIETWRAEAERLGIKVDKRWKITRLKAEIDKAA